MAAFPQHMQFSTLCGVGYAAALHFGFGRELPHSIVAGGLCSLSGMLPDLDSDSGKPLREMVNLISVIGGIVCYHRMGTGNPDMRLLLAAATYFLLRFGLAFFLKRLTEHRGMFHSIPAMLIPALLVYLVWNRKEHADGLVLAIGVGLGYFSHLLLDEIYAIDFNGIAIKPNQFSGTALKLTNPKDWKSTFLCWSILSLLSYRVAVDEGYLKEYLPSLQELRAMKQRWFDQTATNKNVKHVTGKVSAPE